MAEPLTPTLHWGSVRRRIASALVFSLVTPGMVLAPMGVGGAEPEPSLPIRSGPVSSSLLPSALFALAPATASEAEGPASGTAPAADGTATEAPVESGDEGAEASPGDAPAEPPADGEPPVEPWTPVEPGGAEAPIETPAGPAPDEDAGGEDEDPAGGQVPVGPGQGREPTPLNPLPLDQQVGECVITGEVYNAALLEPVEQAIVTVIGSGREAETDAEGRFRIDGLPAGDYTVEARKLGFSAGTAPASPRPGTPVEVRISLEVKRTDAGDGEFMLAEEVVVGEYSETNQGDFVFDLAGSASLSSGLTAEDFAKENVSDAGEAVAKVSGANIVDGKFAVVRGLSDRYIGTTFNGGQVSSAVSDRKAIELDLFPTSAIEAIDVSKTYNPSLLGDFGGAAIDIKSRFFPREPIAFVKVKGKYNPELPGTFLEIPGKSLGFLGSTSRNLNPADYTRTNPNNGQIRLITSPRADALANWQLLDSTRSPYPVYGDSAEEWSYGVGLGNTYEVTDSLDLGILVGHSWKSGSDYNESRELRAPERSWTQQDYQKFTEWDTYAAASARLNDQHEVSAVYFRKHIGENNLRYGSDLRDPNDGFGYGNTGIDVLQGTRPYYGADAELLGGFFEGLPQERDLRILQLGGSHRAGDRGIRANWSLTDSDAKEIQGNTTFHEFTTLDFDSRALDVAQRNGEDFISGFAEDALGLEPGSLSYEEARQIYIDLGAEDLLNSFEDQYLPVRNPDLGRIDTLAIAAYAGTAGPGNILSRASQSIKEQTLDGKLGLDIPYYFSKDHEDDGFELGLGAESISRERRTRGSLYELVYEDLSASGTRQRGFALDDFYPSGDSNGNGLSNLGELLFDGRDGLGPYFTGLSAEGPFYQDGSIGTDNFLGLVANNADATHDIESFYLSGNLFFGDTYLRGGLRHESEERRAKFVEPKPVGEEDPAPLLEEVWLPAVSVGTAVFEGKLNLAAAWSRTLARPTFFEWVPTRSFDLTTGFIRSGNPDLANSTISNFDFAAEFTPVENRTFRVSFFRKEIQDPIVEVRVPGVADSITFINGETGSISGVEFEAEISEIGPFSLKSNVTYIDATLEYAFNTGQLVSVNFPYQPNWIANLNLGYEHEEWDLGVNLIYNFTGEYATLLKTVPSAPNVLREAQHTLDLVVRKGFEFDNGDRLGISLGIENLVGTDQVFRFDGGPDSVDGKVRSSVSRDRLYFAELKWDF